GNVTRPLHEQLRHQRMVPDRLAIIPDLSICSLRNLAIQLELARNDRLREVTFADEIWYDVNIFDRVRIKKIDRVAQTRLFLPKRARHIAENISPTDFGRMRQRRRARIRIYRRAMTDD